MGTGQEAGPPIRVCYLVAYFHPFESGAERQAHVQGRELVRRGHTVHVLTHAMPSVPREEIIDGIQVHRWIRSSKRGALFAPSFVASAAHGLFRLRGRYDLVHTHQALWEAVAAGVARGWLTQGAPTLIQPASSGFFGEAEELGRIRGARFLRRLILRNGAFVAISADIERQWHALGVEATRMTRIASGVDTSIYHPGSSRLELGANDGPVVLFTGRLHPQKSLDILFDAWPRVARETRALLVLAGDGPERGRLETRADELDLGDRVRFLGRVDDVADVLRAADLFVLPSVAEGMSNSLLEAMATGLACIASDIGGNQDLLAPGEAGCLVSHRTPDAWADAIIGLLQNPTHRSRLGSRALRRIHEEFSIARVVDRYVALYRGLLAGRNRLDLK
ncbi:MAG: glycosyltransferase family 4 protein [Isosphaeraceae bacterium]